MDGSSLTHSDPFVYSLPSTQRHPTPPPLHSVPSPSHFLSYALSHHNMQFSYWLLGLSIHSVRQSKGGPVCGFTAYATMYLLFVCELAFSLHSPIIICLYPTLPLDTISLCFTLSFPPPSLFRCYCLSPPPPRYQVRYLSPISIVNHPGTLNLQLAGEVSH